MGTRGIYGFHKNGTDKLTYNHWDSYPVGLGKDIIEFLRQTSIKELNTIFDQIILVDEDSKPTPEIIKECIQYADLRVANRSNYNWYCLLRKTQGDLNCYRYGLQYMIDSKEFIKDSLFCEWGYIINLDTNMLEIYKGFRERPNSYNNRYGINNPQELAQIDKHYYACEPVVCFDLDNIPADWNKVLSRVLISK
jgi:hypothetical protein